MIHGDYELVITDSGEHRGTRSVHLVAGSSRGGRAKLSGHVVVSGSRVMLDDDSGWRMSLVRRGDVRYGVNADPATQRPISITLEKVSRGEKAERQP